MAVDPPQQVEVMPPHAWLHEPAFRTKADLVLSRRAENLRVASTFGGDNKGTKAHGRRYVMSGVMHPRPQRDSNVDARTDHIAFQMDEQPSPTKTRTALRMARREANLQTLEYVYRLANNNQAAEIHGLPPPPAEKKKRSKGRTRSDVLQDRKQERLLMNKMFQELHEEQSNHPVDPAESWWKKEPGYVDDPSAMIAASHRVKMNRTLHEELKFDGSKTRTVTIQDVMEKHAKKTNFPEKITAMAYRPSTAGARIPQNVKWTDAIIKFSQDPNGKQDAVLMEKYDLRFKEPLGSSFTKDKIFHEDRIKGLPQVRPTQAVDPLAIDKSAKATKKLFVASTAKRRELDERKAERGMSAPPIRPERKPSLHATYHKQGKSSFEHDRIHQTVRASGFDQLDLDRLLRLDANASTVLAKKVHTENG
ncbi:hypothetical protein Ae201684P_011558 [Aphanomyces euteiches]|nr:hypothetical protein Ae201684P_011558 [Aphanomyces euteiches]